MEQKKKKERKRETERARERKITKERQSEGRLPEGRLSS